MKTKARSRLAVACSTLGLVLLSSLAGTSTSSALWADYRGSYTETRAQNAVYNYDQEDDGQFTSGPHTHYDIGESSNVVNKKGYGKWANDATGSLVVKLRSCESQGGIQPMSCGSWWYAES